MNQLGGGVGTIIGSELELDFARLGDGVVLAAVLVAVSVTAHNDGLGPAGHKTRDVANDNGLTEDGSVEDVANSAVGALPHLLEAELFNTGLVGGDGGALDTNLGALHGLGAVNGDLVAGLVTVLNRKIVVLGLQVDVRVDVLPS